MERDWPIKTDRQVQPAVTERLSATSSITGTLLPHASSRPSIYITKVLSNRVFRRLFLRSIMPPNMWPDNGGFYRGVPSLDTAWQASPVIPDAPDPFDGFPWNPAWVHEESEKERARRLGIRRKATCGSFWRGLRTLISTFREIYTCVASVADTVFYNCRG